MRKGQSVQFMLFSHIINKVAVRIFEVFLLFSWVLRLLPRIKDIIDSGISD